MFPTTRWTIVLSSRAGDAARRDALETLLPLYWKPIYFFLRRKGLSVESAEDATQGFLLHVLEHDALPRADPARGRFRSYLLSCLENYMANQYARDAAVKRGGRMQSVALDTDVAERQLPSVEDDPGRAFDREWAVGLMERALVRLAGEYGDGRRKGPADAFLVFFQLDEAPSYADSAARCDMTVTQFKAALHRARERFREILREEVAATVDGDADAEWRAIQAALRG